MNSTDTDQYIEGLAKLLKLIESEREAVEKRDEESMKTIILEKDEIMKSLNELNPVPLAAGVQAKEVLEKISEIESANLDLARGSLEEISREISELRKQSSALDGYKTVQKGDASHFIDRMK